MEKTFYNYSYRDNTTNNMIYIGKAISSSDRHLDHLKGTGNKIIASKLRKGRTYTIKTFNHNITEQKAFDNETKLIKKYGRVCDGTGTLYNLTLGGEGASGYIYTEDSIVKRYKNRCVVTLENIKTGEIKTWQSLGLAAKELNTCRQCIYGVYKGKIQVFKKLWKLPGKVIVKNENSKKPISIKDLTTNKIYNFKSRAEAANMLNVKKGSITLLVKGKQIHIGRRYVLPPTTKTDINNIPKPGVCNRGRLKPEQFIPIKIYDRKQNKFLNFKSQKECSLLIGSSNGDVSILVSGKIQSLKKGRYTLHKPNKQYGVNLLDIKTDEKLFFENVKHAADKLNVKLSTMYSFILGYSKLCKRRYKLL